MEVHYKKLTENATAPVRATPQSAGLDLFTAYEYNIGPQCRQLCHTDIALACPENTYGRVAPRSGLAVKHGIDVGAGVVFTHKLLGYPTQYFQILVCFKKFF